MTVRLVIDPLLVRCDRFSRPQQTNFQLEDSHLTRLDSVVEMADVSNAALPDRLIQADSQRAPGGIIRYNPFGVSRLAASLRVVAMIPGHDGISTGGWVIVIRDRPAVTTRRMT